jgi:hypothetical protein
MQLTWNGAGRLLLAIGVALGLTLSVAPAIAHEGHAGKKQVLLDTKLALKQMLPDGAKIVRRKEVPSKAVSDWARQTHGVRLEWEGVVNYFVARGRESGELLGTAMVYEFDYRHGKATLAIGMDTNGHVTRAAILSAHGKYVPELMRVGKGFIPVLDGVSIAELNDHKAAAKGMDRGGHFIYWHLRDMAATLASLQQQM